MPFRSEKQRRFMWAQHPQIARRWTEEYGSSIHPTRRKTSVTKGQRFLRKLSG